jgi:hypothetical protein
MRPRHSLVRHAHDQRILGSRHAEIAPPEHDMLHASELDPRRRLSGQSQRNARTMDGTALAALPTSTSRTDRVLSPLDNARDSSAVLVAYLEAPSLFAG